MNTYELGTPAELTVTFVDAVGAPLNPMVVTAKVRKPDDTITTYGTPPVVVNATAGTAKLTVTLDQSGFWFGRFESSNTLAAPREYAVVVRESAFDTAATDGGPYFGATIDGVAGRLPDRTFTDTSKPTEGEVARFIMEIAARVAARIGAVSTITDTQRRADLLKAARGLVHLGAASYAEAAGAPEQADANAATSYAQWLWERFSEGLDDLAKTTLGLIPPDTTDDPSISAGSPVWSFPNTPAYGKATTSWESYRHGGFPTERCAHGWVR